MTWFASSRMLLRHFPRKVGACPVWDTYDEILEACKNAWNFLIDDPDRIRSIGARDWASVNV
jgi:hypothetical protein